MSSRQSKNYSHIWDNFNGVTARRNPYYLNASLRDTTGSSTVSILEYSHEEILVVSPREKCPIAVKTKKPKHKDIYVSNRERAQAEPPKALATWKYQAVRKEKYNPHCVSDAFDAYQHRLKLKKWAEPKLATHTHTHTTHKKRVTINETATEVVEDTCPKYQKVRITNCRNDEIKIDNFSEKTVECEDVVASEDDDIIVTKIQKTSKPGFYGTIEAEQSAEAVAGHLSYACEHLERLRFMTDAVYPQATDHLNKLREVEDDVKEFNSQMRVRRVKVPVSAGTHTQIAHFIITDN